MGVGHYVVKCTGCGTIISQCRCPGNKEQRTGICAECRKPVEFGGPEAAQARSLREALELLFEAERWLVEVETLVMRAHDSGFEHAVAELGQRIRLARKAASLAVAP